jgi:hypothetical protein
MKTFNLKFSETILINILNLYYEEEQQSKTNNICFHLEI